MAQSEQSNPLWRVVACGFARVDSLVQSYFGEWGRMKSKFPTVLLLTCAAAFSASAAPGADRCGWFDNPTPQNVYLIDRDRT